MPGLLTTVENLENAGNFVILEVLYPVLFFADYLRFLHFV